MRNNNKITVCIVKIVLGIGLIVAAKVADIDSFWAGMGAALVVVGAVRLVQQIQYTTNKEYKENMDIEVNDERNQYVAMKAASLAVRIYVLGMGVAAIVLKILNYDTYVTFAAGSICVLMILYWLSYLYANNKY